MAAAPDRHALEVVDLMRVRAEELDPVLDEEKLAWRSNLSWDFTSSADLVRRFVKIQALNGYALLASGVPVGYAYYVCEDRKGLIGDVFLMREVATPENEDLLLGPVLSSLVSRAQVERIEAQLMMLHGPFERPLPFSAHANIFPRLFMLAELDTARMEHKGDPSGVVFRYWSENVQDEAAALIATAYQQHVDSSINDQYRSFAGARRFINNVVNYPGCGSFYEGASIYAYDAAGRMVGVILSSLVAEETGHITQVCVAPEAQGQGIGYELVRRALTAFREVNCEKTSLTVTASNVGAIRLYQQIGFRSVRRFAAYVWEGF
jgi:ribosomal protein S18 acetylase RimI-like enzyme